MLSDALLAGLSRAVSQFPRYRSGRIACLFACLFPTQCNQVAGIPQVFPTAKYADLKAASDELTTLVEGWDMIMEEVSRDGLYCLAYPRFCCLNLNGRRAERRLRSSRPSSATSACFEPPSHAPVSMHTRTHDDLRASTVSTVSQFRLFRIPPVAATQSPQKSQPRTLS